MQPCGSCCLLPRRQLCSFARPRHSSSPPACHTRCESHLTKLLHSSRMLLLTGFVSLASLPPQDKKENRQHGTYGNMNQKSGLLPLALFRNVIGGRRTQRQQSIGLHLHPIPFAVHRQVGPMAVCESCCHQSPHLTTRRGQRCVEATAEGAAQWRPAHTPKE
eukprot:scaffold231553_cov28-Tisochrysis_lutea.AAC.2